jgi:hypothetical protein
MRIIEEILDLELEMFLAVPAEGNPTCREAPDSFRIHRGAQFSVWSEDTLKSYLSDLKGARAGGRNLMTYKYARMDELIPSENESPLVDKITLQQVAWQLEVVSRYPGLKANARSVADDGSSWLSVSFKRYLTAELESYSAQTLLLLSRDVEKFKVEGVNMSEKIYENLASAAGYKLTDILK